MIFEELFYDGKRSKLICRLRYRHVSSLPLLITAWMGLSLFVANVSCNYGAPIATPIAGEQYLVKQNDPSLDLLRPMFSSARSQSRLHVFKKSESPQWEDLGWVWGKRAAAPPVIPSSSSSERHYLPNTVRVNYGAAALVKKTPDWHDLGWAWGRK